MSERSEVSTVTTASRAPSRDEDSYSRRDESGSSPDPRTLEEAIKVIFFINYYYSTGSVVITGDSKLFNRLRNQPHDTFSCPKL